MTSIQRLASQTSGTSLPRLVGGLRTPNVMTYMPHRHAEHLAAWAAEQGISEHADVAVTSVIQRPTSGPTNRGPLERFTREEMRAIEPDADMSNAGGWGLEVITEDERISLDMFETGQIADVRRKPLRRDQPARHDAEPLAARLRNASVREIDLRRDLEAARVSRNVTIRAALAQNLTPRQVAEFTSLGEQRIYQIRDERR